MKRLMIVVCLICVVGVIQAQLKVGVKVGLNVSTLSGDVEHMKAKIGAHAGLFASLSLMDKLAVQPELLFSMQGAKQDYEHDPFDDEFDSDKISYKFDYILVPIMLKYYLTKGLNIEAGPQLGYLASAKVEDIDMKDDLKKMDFSINVGAGYDFGSLGLSARYSFGLSNLDDDKDSHSDVKNGVFFVSLSYAF